MTNVFGIDMHVEPRRYKEIVENTELANRLGISTGGGGVSLDFPTFDFGPFDYLEFAEKARVGRKTNEAPPQTVEHVGEARRPGRSEAEPR